jgi:hypothetical protein
MEKVEDLWLLESDWREVLNLLALTLTPNPNPNPNPYPPETQRDGGLRTSRLKLEGGANQTGTLYNCPLIYMIHYDCKYNTYTTFFIHIVADGREGW